MTYACTCIDCVLCCECCWNTCTVQCCGWIHLVWTLTEGRSCCCCCCCWLVAITIVCSRQWLSSSVFLSVLVFLWICETSLVTAQLVFTFKVHIEPGTVQSALPVLSRILWELTWCSQVSQNAFRANQWLCWRFWGRLRAVVIFILGLFLYHSIKFWYFFWQESNHLDLEIMPIWELALMFSEMWGPAGWVKISVLLKWRSS